MSGGKSVSELFIEFLDKHGADQYVRVHRRRYIETFNRLLFAWHPIAGVDRDAIMDLLRNYGADTQHRGDDAFFIFTKPGAQP